jgi:prevent-host-death family protein
MKQLSCTEAAGIGFPTLMNRAAFGLERLILTRHGKPIAALVPISDVAQLSRLEAESAPQLEAIAQQGENQG